MAIDKAGLALAALIIVGWMAPKLWQSTGINPPRTRSDVIMVVCAWVALFGALASCVWGILK